MANGENSIVMGYVYNSEGKPESVGAMMPPQLPRKVSALEGRVDALETSGGTGSGPALSDAVDSTSSTTAASSKAVKIAYDKAAEAQNVADEAIAKAVNYTGATATEPGVAGLVPPAAAGEQEKFLRGDGTFAYPAPSLIGTLYVNSSTGRDTNDGLTAETPFATVSEALRRLITRYAINSGGVTINVATGEYKEKINVPNPNSTFGFINIVGESDVTFILENKMFIETGLSKGLIRIKNINVDFQCNEYSSVSGVVFCGDFSKIEIEGCKFKIKKTNSKVLNIINCIGGRIDISNCAFSCDDANKKTILFNCSTSGNIWINNSIEINGTYNKIVFSDTKSLCCFSGTSFSWNPTGKRYDVNRGSMIATGGQGIEYIPGTEAGTVDKTSHYL